MGPCGLRPQRLERACERPLANLLPLRDGLPSDDVNCLLEDSSGMLWIGTAAAWPSGTTAAFNLPRMCPPPCAEQVLGLAEDKNGSIWMATSNRVLRVNRDKLLARRARRRGSCASMGSPTACVAMEGVKRSSSVVADPVGRIWFSLNQGISVVDPARLRNNAAPAIAHIQAILADGQPIGLRGPIHIPGGRQRITFDYAGLSLSVPDRVRLRYQLDGFDRGWSEPTATRQAVYTNLPPGPYRFRLIASNPDGVWSNQEADIGFAVEPLFWQTWWFRLSIVLACALAIVALYRLRLHVLTRQLNVRLKNGWPNARASRRNCMTLCCKASSARPCNCTSRWTAFRRIRRPNRRWAAFCN